MKFIGGGFVEDDCVVGLILDCDKESANSILKSYMVVMLK